MVETMKKTCFKFIAGLQVIILAFSTQLSYTKPESTRHKVVAATQQISSKNSSLWQRIKSFFGFAPRYKTVMIPLQVHPQKGLECGLCAVENGARVYNYLKNTTKFSKDGLGRVAQLPYSQSWRELCIDGFGRKDNLSDDELDAVAVELAELPSDAYTIIQSVKQFNVDFLTDEQRKHFSATIKKLRTTVGTKHLFIIGNMQEIKNKDGNIQGVDGHWVSAVVERTRDGFIYYTMDSISSRCPASVETLQQLIEKHPLK